MDVNYPYGNEDDPDGSEDDLASFDMKSLHQYINCDACGQEHPKRRCSRCHYAYYCSVACQRNHWKKEHNCKCVTIRDLQASSAGFGSSAKEMFAGNDETPVNSSCGICRAEPMAEPWTLKGCRHAFCFRCLAQWQKYSGASSWVPAGGKRQQNPRCPFCRSKMEMGVAEHILEQARLYVARSCASRIGKDEKSSLVAKAVVEIDKILATDPEDLRALLLKAKALKDSQPAESIEVFEQCFRLDASTKAKITESERMLAQSEVALKDGDIDEYNRLSILYNERIELPTPYMVTATVLKMKLVYAETLLSSGRDAIEVISIYQNLLGENAEELDAVTRTVINRRLYSGLSQCAFLLKDYEKASVGAEAALSLSSQCPGAHKLLAQVQEAQGDVASAFRTMAHGVLYEHPGDKQNLQKNIRYFLELKKILAL